MFVVVMDYEREQGNLNRLLIDWNSHSFDLECINMPIIMVVTND